MRITVNTAEFAQGIQAAKAEFAARIRQAVEVSCAEIEGAAREKCPKGNEDGKDASLRKSITTWIEADDERVRGKVGSPLVYAIYVHEGTGLFSRTGRGRGQPGGKQLPVPWHYRDLFGHWHTTSGIKATPFLEEAADEKREHVAQIFRDIVGGGTP